MFIEFCSAMGTEQVGKHFSHQTSYNVAARTVADSGAVDIFRQGTRTNAFLPQDVRGTATGSPVTADLTSEFKRIYQAAVEGGVKQAFDFLVALKQVPICLELSCLGTEYGVFVGNIANGRYQQGLQQLLGTHILNDDDTRGVVLKFMAKHQAVVSLVGFDFGKFNAQYKIFVHQIKQYLERQEMFKYFVLRNFVLLQNVVPAFCKLVAGILAIVVFADPDNSSKKSWCGSFGVVSVLAGDLLDRYVNYQKWCVENSPQFNTQAQKTAEILGAYCFKLMETDTDLSVVAKVKQQIDNAMKDERYWKKGLSIEQVVLT